MARTPGGDGGLRTRNMPFDDNLVANTIQRTELGKAKARANSRGPVAARGVLLSGCADNQLSQEVNGAGVFTTAVNRLWAANGFVGDHAGLTELVVSGMGPTRTPQLTTFGVDGDVLAARTPFDAT